MQCRKRSKVEGRSRCEECAAKARVLARMCAWPGCINSRHLHNDYCQAHKGRGHVAGSLEMAYNSFIHKL